MGSRRGGDAGQDRTKQRSECDAHVTIARSGADGGSGAVSRVRVSVHLKDGLLPRHGVGRTSTIRHDLARQRRLPLVA